MPIIMLSRKRLNLYFALLPACAVPYLAAQAADCDFSKPSGSCVGSIEVVSSSGSKPSYSAEIIVRTSEVCSKVEYFLDGTPHQTVFRSSTSEGESLFGTKPILKDNIKVTRCTTYNGNSSASLINDCEKKLKDQIPEVVATHRSTLAQCSAPIYRTLEPNPAGIRSCLDQARSAGRSKLLQYVSQANNCAGREAFKPVGEREGRGMLGLDFARTGS